jgi:hypothetical protein
MSDFKMNAWPTPEEERNVGRASARPIDGLKPVAHWRQMSAIVQIVFFVLTILAISAFYGFCRLLNLPAGWIVLVGSIAIAELLIRRAHFWRTGVESALWIGGLYAFIFSLPSSGKPEAILVLAAAAALAGWRVRNALFGGLAMAMVVTYLVERQWFWNALAFAIVVTLIALVALTREWKRPSTEMLWQVLEIVMPVAGYVAIVTRLKSWISDYRIFAIFFALAALFLIVGIRFRLRVPLMAAIVSLAIAIVEAHDYMPVSVEAELIVIGAITLSVAAAIMRALRDKQHGFVIGVAKKSDLQDVLSVAPTLLSVHGGAPHDAPQPVGGGGEFGGAGASGNF